MLFRDWEADDIEKILSGKESTKQQENDDDEDDIDESDNDT